MEKITNNIQAPSDSTVVLESRGLQYGVATGTSLPAETTLPVMSPDLSLKLRFFMGELFGFLFVLLSTMYIFVVPASLSRPVHIRAMVDKTLKRTLDVVGATVGLMLTFPLWILIAFAIKIDTPGPVFYTQTRVGINRRKRSRRCFNRAVDDNRRDSDRRRTDYMGRPFQVIKFRTMVTDAEKACGPVWAVKGDPRITRVGAILRRARLDEIPQFFNVLKGDMSLVGPRPERPNFVRDLSTQVEGYSTRLQVKPGLTGLAQVENGYDSSVSSVSQKVKYDIEYIREWSLWTDIKIMMRTVVVVFTGRGAC